MTKITAVLDRVARKCSIPAQSSWLTTTNGAAVELRDDFLPQCIDEMRKRHDWASPISKETTITGTGAVNYALPSDFVRLGNSTLAVYETTTTRRKVFPVSSDGAWTHLNDIGSAGGDRYYRIKGYDGSYTMDFFQALETGSSVKVHYLSNIWMKNSAGTEGSAFTDADDELLIPRRVVETYMIYQFRRDAGLDYAAEKESYEMFMATAMNRNRDIDTVNFGETILRDFRDIPVPDFIPPS